MAPSGNAMLQLVLRTCYMSPEAESAIGAHTQSSTAEHVRVDGLTFLVCEV